MIVDDEPWVREGIVNLIDWEAHGMEIVGAFEDGTDALEFVKRSERAPDIVLTDIRMPGKSGLDLIEELSEINDRVRFLILSGYRDFAYAQSAIRYGVFDYMVKPVGKKALLSTVLRLIREIEGEGSESSTYDGTDDHPVSDPHVQEEDRSSYPLLICRMLDSLDKHITEAVGLGYFADELSVNPSYLSTLFRETTGESFKQYITKRKVEKAMDIWKQHPWLKVYELCTRVGYQDVNHFSRTFKQVTGVTPSRYKRGLISVDEGHTKVDGTH
jgi:two-component system response regulator YesN